MLPVATIYEQTFITSKLGSIIMGKLVDDVMSAYSTWKASKDVTAMNESELTQYNLTDLKFNKAITDAQALETAFYAARSEAFEAFESQKRNELAALQSVWQGYEDNDMTVA